jgi:hypothetical protein
LPLGFVLTSEITYNDISAIQYENLNIKASTSSLTGADTRPRYNGASRVDDKYLEFIWVQILVKVKLII